MKNYKMLASLILLFGGMNIIFAQADITEADLKAALSSVFDASVKENYTKACSLMLNDELKEKRAFNPSENSEIKAVKRQCKKIKAYIDLSDSYEYTKYTPTKIDGQNGAVLEVSFKSGDQKLNIGFTFVKLGGKVLLVGFK